MLIIRVGYVDTAEARVHADAIAAVLQAMPVTRQLDGTVVIGCGGATGIADATRPVVAVPMAWLLAPDALTRVRIGRVDAVVLADATELMAVRDALTPDTVVVVSGPDHEESAFLRGASERETAAARDVIASHPELAAALRADLGVSVIGDPAVMALACVEAIVATGTTDPATGGTVEGQG